MEVEFPSDQRDINSNYQIFITRLAQPRPNLKQARDAKTKQDDYFRTLRTRVVLSWMLCNAAVV